MKKSFTVKQILKYMDKFYQGNPDVYEKLSGCEDKNNEIMKNVLRIFNFKDKVVVDLGCGTGRFTIPLARKAKKVYALDKTESMLRMLRKVIRKKGVKNIEIIKSDFGGINLPKESVDLVFSCWAFPCHSSNWERDIRKFKRILKTGGMMIICDSAPRGEYWGMRKDILGNEYKESIVPKVEKWFLKKGFKSKSVNALLEFKNKNGVRRICKPFYGGEIAGYMIAKGKHNFNIGMSIFYWEKK